MHVLNFMLIHPIVVYSKPIIKRTENVKFMVASAEKIGGSQSILVIQERLKPPIDLYYVRTI